MGKLHIDFEKLDAYFRSKDFKSISHNEALEELLIYICTELKEQSGQKPTFNDLTSASVELIEETKRRYPNISRGGDRQ